MTDDERRRDFMEMASVHLIRLVWELGPADPQYDGQPATDAVAMAAELWDALQAWERG